MSVAATLFLSSAMLSPLCQYDGRDIVGVAFDSQGQFVYCEEISIRNKNLFISYTKGKISFAEKLVNAENSDTLPSVSQMDSRNGEKRVAEVRYDQKKLQLSYQETQRDKLKSDSFNIVEVDAIDAGFNAFIQSHFDELQLKKVLHVRFASIAHLDIIKLSLKPVNTKECVNKKVDTSKISIVPITNCIKVDIDNALLRLVIPSLHLGYDGKRQLVYFNGTVNINDDKAKSQQVTLYYNYLNNQQ